MFMLSADDASFSCTPQGQARIDFKDPVFVRADTVFYDPASNEVSALVDGIQFKIGQLPRGLAATFQKHSSVILTAPHPQGFELVLSARISTIH